MLSSALVTWGFLSGNFVGVSIVYLFYSIVSIPITCYFLWNKFKKEAKSQGVVLNKNFKSLHAEILVNLVDKSLA